MARGFERWPAVAWPPGRLAARTLAWSLAPCVQGASPGHVPGGPDPRLVLDRAAVIGGNGPVVGEGGPRVLPAGAVGQDHPVDVESIAGVRGQVHPAVRGLLRGGGPGAGSHGDAGRGEDFGQVLGDGGVFAGNQLAGGLDQGHLRAGPRVDRGEFAAGRAAAQDSRRARVTGSGQGLAAGPGQVTQPVQPAGGRDDRHRPGGDDQVLVPDLPVPDLDGARSGRPGKAAPGPYPLASAVPWTGSVPGPRGGDNICRGPDPQLLQQPALAPGPGDELVQLARIQPGILASQDPQRAPPGRGGP